MILIGIYGSRTFQSPGFWKMDFSAFYLTLESQTPGNTTPELLSRIAPVTEA